MADRNNTGFVGEEGFGAWLRASREKCGLTIAQLAKASGVCFAQVCNIETGRTRNPRTVTRERLRNALMRSEDRARCCSFCGAAARDVPCLVVSPIDEAVHICDGCVGQVIGLLSRRERERQGRPQLWVIEEK